MLKMDLEYDQKILFVRLKGNLNRKTCYKINNYLNPVIIKHKIKYLIYNCNNLTTIDTSGIDAIVSSKYLIKSNKGLIRACTNNIGLKEIFNYIKVPLINNEANAYTLVGDN